MRLLFVSLSMLLASTTLSASNDGDRVVIERGTAKLTLSDIDGRISRVPALERPAYAMQAQNLGNLMNRLLINRQLANEARDLGLDQDPQVRRDLELAMEEVLATHRLNALVDPQQLPDFEQLAHERYLADPTRFATREQVRIEHILVGTEDRDEQAALERAHSILQEARAPGADFTALVQTHSDDPSKDDNAGRYVIDQPGQFVPEFEAAGRALTEPGQISEPIQTEFGYHLIRLLERTPATQPEFADVRQELVNTIRQEYLSTVRDNHRSALQSLPDSGDEELLISLPARYGGRPEIPRPSAGE